MGRHRKHWGRGAMPGKKLASSEDIVRLKVEGKSLRDIAKELGVSVPAIHKRVRKLDGEIKKAVVIKESGLSEGEVKFAQAVINGDSLRSAAMNVRQDLLPGALSNYATELSRRTDIRKLIRELMEASGIGLRARVGKLAEHVNNMDATTSLKALDMSFKLDGSLINDNHTETTVNVGIMDLSAYALKPVEVRNV
jgi:DNA-binding Lrp family transcriptional regulator